MEIDKNIALIGMPGSGKTSLARLLAEELEADFIDLDDYIRTKYNKSSQELFKMGEEYFRALEHEALVEIVNLKPRIIATGGGIVENPNNMKYLSQDRIILFINRPVDEIMKDMDLSRPLFKKDPNRLYKLFERRYPLYKKYSHVEIMNHGSLGEAVKRIMDYLASLD